MFSALLDTKAGGEEGCRKEIESLVLTLQGHCHGNRKGVVEGVEKGTVSVRGQGPTGVLAPFRVHRMQLPSLSFVNEATDCSFWGSFPKVCHEKEARC